MGVFNQTIGNIKMVMSRLLGNTDVEPSHEDNLKNILRQEMADSAQERKNAAELLLTNEKNREWSEKVDKRQEKDIQPDATDKTDFRVTEIEPNNIVAEPTTRVRDKVKELDERIKE